VAEFALGAIELAVAFIRVVRSDPWIGWTLAVLLVAGILAAILIRRSQHDDPLTLR
jgi:hypothetical protein